MVRENLIKLVDYFFGGNVFLESTKLPEETPLEYCTFWNFSSDTMRFNNKVNAIQWGYNIKLYCKSPVRLEELKTKILETLESNGYIADGRGYDFASPDRVCWTCDFYFLEEL